MAILVLAEMIPFASYFLNRSDPSSAMVIESSASWAQMNSQKNRV